jgi:hypothetical protein
MRPSSTLVPRTVPAVVVTCALAEAAHMRVVAITIAAAEDADDFKVRVIVMMFSPRQA